MQLTRKEWKELEKLSVDERIDKLYDKIEEERQRLMMRIELVEDKNWTLRERLDTTRARLVVSVIIELILSITILVNYF